MTDEDLEEIENYKLDDADELTRVDCNYIHYRAAIHRKMKIKYGIGVDHFPQFIIDDYYKRGKTVHECWFRLVLEIHKKGREKQLAKLKG